MYTGSVTNKVSEIFCIPSSGLPNEGFPGFSLRYKKTALMFGESEAWLRRDWVSILLCCKSVGEVGLKCSLRLSIPLFLFIGHRRLFVYIALEFSAFQNIISSTIKVIFNLFLSKTYDLFYLTTLHWLDSDTISKDVIKADIFALFLIERGSIWFIDIWIHYEMIPPSHYPSAHIFTFLYV